MAEWVCHYSQVARACRCAASRKPSAGYHALKPLLAALVAVGEQMMRNAILIVVAHGDARNSVRAANAALVPTIVVAVALVASAGRDSRS